MEPINFVLFEDSNWCNMQCPYCTYWDLIQENKRKVLSRENLEKIYSFIESNRVPMEALHLYTEPLLNWENLRLVIPNYNLTHVNHNIYTNGLLLDEEKLNFFLLYGVNVTLSFDGLNQDKRMPNTFTKLYDFIKRFPYCVSISCTARKNGIDNFIKNAEFLLKLPIKGCSYKPNTSDNWSFEELQDYYYTLFSKFNERDLDKLSLSRDAVKDLNSLSPLANRKNAIFVKSDGRVYQHIEDWITEPLGNCDNFLKNIKDRSKVNFFNPKRDCDSCELKKICRPHSSAVEVSIGEGSCDYRKMLFLR